MWAISIIRRGSFASAANRLGGVVDQYPLYSRADEALWLEGDSYTRLGPRFRQQAGDTYTRLVRDYPLSEYADQAKTRLKTLEMPIPAADPAAEARMQFEKENRTSTRHVPPAHRIYPPESGHQRGREIRHAADESAQAEYSGDRSGAGLAGRLPGRCDGRAGDGSLGAR